MELNIYKATTENAEKISEIWSIVCAERIYTAVDIPFTLQQERDYISSLSEREGIFIADLDGKIVGFQSLELWSRSINSFKHVGTMGTIILPKWRGTKISYILANHSLEYARANDYEKIIIYVRKQNERAIKFYQNLGFIIKGELEKQVKINNIYENEIFMELFL